MIALRKEIQNFASSCEQLLSLCLTAGEEPLSEDEHQLILYYLDELRGLTAPNDRYHLKNVKQPVKGV